MGKKIDLNKISDNTEKLYRKLKKITKSNVFQTWFSFAIIVFSLLSMSQASAQVPPAEEAQNFELESETPWVETQFIHEALFNKEGTDVVTSTIHSTAGLLQGVVAIVDPTTAPNYQAALEKYGDQLPESSKYGLLHIVDSLNEDLLNNHPNVDVVAHLTEEWVPGFDTSSNSIYAQSGYTFLQDTNLSTLWEKTRLIAYAAFVVVLIAAGFMIMFRQKIGGQMMVTVFNTLPKVIVGLFLVTFSFAIVGIVIDIGAVLIRVISSVLNTGPNPVVVTNPFSLIGVLFRGTNGNFSPLTLTGGGVGGGVLGIVGGLLASGGAIAGIPGVLIIGGIIALVITLVVIGIVFMASLKVFTTLFKAYLGIILDTIMAPLYLTLAVIPGKESLGHDWFNRVLKNVLTFVGVFLIVNLAMYMQAQNVNFSFPKSLAGGVAEANTDFTIIGFLIQKIMPIFLFFMAAEVPNFLSDFLPEGGGKGAATAMQGIQKSFGKIPIIGSFFG